MAQLIIPDEPTYQNYTVVGSQTAFPFGFAIFSKADLRFTVNGVELAQSDFTLTGTLLDGGGYQGGVITLNSAVTSGTCQAWRDIAPARATNFAPSQSVPVRDIDMSLNRSMAIDQDAARGIGLAVKVPPGETGFNLPAAATRANKFFGFDAQGLPAILYSLSDFATAVSSLALQTALGGAAAAAVAAAVSALVGNDIRPTDYGAIGDGASHPITAPDIAAHPEWIVAYPVGTQWDTVGVQESLLRAFAKNSTPGNIVWNSPANNQRLNRSWKLTNGFYLIDKALILNASGFALRGYGSLASRLVWLGDPSLNMFTMDSGAYGSCKDIGFQWNAAKGNGSCLNVDGTGTYGGLKTQQITFANCAFFGQGNAKDAIVISRAGGSAQGDTIALINCFFQGGWNSGLSIGGGSSAQNALGISVINGDFQSCYKYGVVVYGGQVLISDTSFQNQNPNSINGQILNGGGDIVQIGTGGYSTQTVARNCRSEGELLVSGSVLVENCSVVGAGIIGWSANHAGIAKGSLCRGTPDVGNPGVNGRTFVAIQAGTTGGGAEPNWDGLAKGTQCRGNGSTGCAITAGTNVVVGNFGYPDGTVPAVGNFMAIAGAGLNGAPHISRIATATDASHFTLDDNALTDVRGAQGYQGATLTDGTIKWIDLDYDVVASASKIVGSRFGCGRSFNVKLMDDVRFARPDWERPRGGGGAFTFALPRFRRNIQVSAGALDNVSDVTFNPQNADGVSNDGPLGYAWNDLGDWLSFPGSGSNDVFPAVGIGRGDGTPANTGAIPSLTKNLLAFMGVLGRFPKVGANLTGDDVIIQGGTGTGTGPSGGLSFRGGPGGGAGSTQNMTAQDAYLDYLGNLGVIGNLTATGYVKTAYKTKAAVLLITPVNGAMYALSDGASNKPLAVAVGGVWRYPDGAAVT